MFDFTQGWMWFVCGLGATVLTTLFIVAVVLLALRGEARARRRQAAGLPSQRATAAARAQRDPTTTAAAA